MAAYLIMGSLVAWNVVALVHVYRLVGAGVMPMALMNGLILVAWLLLLIYDGSDEGG
jgi:hypothetical protein